MIEGLYNDIPTDNDEHDGLSHYIDEDDMMHALVFCKPARALCGKIWVPQQDGSDFPMCPECDDSFNSYFGSE
jgi:hypothetical protein